MKKYLISGIPPSKGGVGYVMQLLEKLAHVYSFEVIYPSYSNKSLRNLFPNPIRLGNEILSRHKSKILFKKKLKTIQNSEVILIHPQTIGLDKFLSLIKNNKIVKWYVMDNSFFCIKSYNVLNGKECTGCLKDLNNCDSKCKSFPTNFNKIENLEYLKTLKRYASKIIFYAQNHMQEMLLKEFYGKQIKTQIIGLKTDELSLDKDLKYTKQYDIVFHGANHEAKGIYYTIELAKYLKDYTLFIPENRDNIKYDGTIPSNIVFKSISWNTGLKELVLNAKLVLNPSVWSAPIEGALIKSIFYCGNVAVPITQYGFVNDIPHDCLLRLTTDIQQSAEIINSFIISGKSLKDRSQSWLNDFLNNSCHLDLLFKEIDNLH